MSDNNTAGRAQPHGDIDFEALKAAIAERDGLAMDAELSSISEVDARHAFFKLSETEQDVVLQGTSLELICDLLEPLPDLEIALLLERIPPSRAAKLLSGLQRLIKLKSLRNSMSKTPKRLRLSSRRIRQPKSTSCLIIPKTVPVV